MKQVIISNKLRLFGKALPVLVFASACLVSCDKDDLPGSPGKPAPVNATIVKGSGDISFQLAQFRSILGETLNTTLPGDPAGRREVNWDGVPAQNTDPNPFPVDFFNSTDPNVGAGRKRGLLYINTDSSLRVSNNAFINIDSSYATQFTPFSAPRTFARLGNNTTQITFKLPGTSTDAFVKGLGVIFIDVDDASSTSLEFFKGTKSLGVFKAPVRTASSNISFLGVHFPDEQVTHVKIIAGNGDLKAGNKDVSNGGIRDLVVMDDFLYNEPKAL